MQTLILGIRIQMSLKMVLHKKTETCWVANKRYKFSSDAYYCSELHLNSAQTSSSFASRLQTVVNSVARPYVVQSVLFIQ
jgi:hypothetical protein